MSFHIHFIMSDSNKSIGWLSALGIYVSLAVFLPYRDLEAGDNRSSGELYCYQRL